jgi:hypothetical protein
MKRLIVCFVLLLFIAMACDKVEDSCKEEKYAAAVVYDFPDSLLVGTTHDLKIQYIIENSCGSFVEFEDSVVNTVTEVKIKTLYEGCSCALEFTEEENFYPLVQNTPGLYTYKFWLSDTDFDTYTLHVHE